MKEFLKFGAIGAAAYLIYRHFTQPAAAIEPATTTPASSPAVDITTRGLLTRAAGVQTANYHVWGYYYAQVRGQAAPAPENVGMGDGQRLITVDEFLAAIATAGMSGLGNWRAA